jgi:hypothetical protein
MWGISSELGTRVSGLGVRICRLMNAEEASGNQPSLKLRLTTRKQTYKNIRTTSSIKNEQADLSC